MAETFDVGPAQGTLRILTGREGAAARAGHDLTLEATRWQASGVIDRESPESSTLNVTVEAGAIEVIEGHGGALPLTDGQRSDIRRNMHEKVLHVDRHATITFSARTVTGTVGKVKVVGDLTLAGVTRPCTVMLSASGPGGRRIEGSATVRQSEFGIKQYSALLGTLKVRDDVEIAMDLLLPAGV